MNKNAQLTTICQYYFNDHKPRLINYLLPSILLSAYEDDNTSYSTKQLQTYLQQLSREIEHNHPSGKEHRQISIKEHKPKSTTPVLNQIATIYKNCPMFDLFIHGSYADGTQTAASDIDDIVILHKETFSSLANLKTVKKILSRLNTYYQTIDPTQHHGHWIFTEYDLLQYNQATIPLPVFERSVAIGRPANLSLYPDSDATTNEFKRIFSNTLAEGIQNTNLLFCDRSNLFYLKDLLSVITLSIPLAFQVKGVILDKKEAISRANEILDDKCLKVLKWSTLLRQEWHTLISYSHYKQARLIAKLIRNRNLSSLVIAKILPSLLVNDLISRFPITKTELDHYFNYLSQHYINETSK